MIDTWKTLKENHNYEINKKGDVRNTKTKKSLSFWETTSGYLTVSLCDNGRQKTFYIHRLVANNFIDNDMNFTEVNHIDGNKKNNHIENLEWCSHKHNIQEAYKNNLIKIKYGKEHKSAKKIKQINLASGETRIWDSMMDVKREKRYSVGCICSACKGKIKTYKQSIWRYACEED